MWYIMKTKPKTELLKARVDVDMKNAVSTVAQASDLDESDIVRFAIRNYLSAAPSPMPAQHNPAQCLVPLVNLS